MLLTRLAGLNDIVLIVGPLMCVLSVHVLLCDVVCRAVQTANVRSGGKTWPSSLHITPLGVSAVGGGSYDYSNLMQEPLADDPSVGGLLWSHQLPGAACNVNPPPPGCYEILFTRFPLNFSSPSY